MWHNILLVAILGCSRGNNIAFAADAQGCNKIFYSVLSLSFYWKIGCSIQCHRNGANIKFSLFILRELVSCDPSLPDMTLLLGYP